MVVQQPQVQPQVPPQTAVPTAQASQIVGPGVQVRALRQGSGGITSARHPWTAGFWLDRAGPGVLGAAPPACLGLSCTGHVPCSPHTAPGLPSCLLPQRAMGWGAGAACSLRASALSMEPGAVAPETRRCPPAVSPDFQDSPLGAHPLHINVDGRKGLPALPSSGHSLLGVWGGWGARPCDFSTCPLAPQPASSPGLGSSCLLPAAAQEGVDSAGVLW